jgi:bifunctional DNA-binding transcriptional regulator/antitoxin component of YhaV-PrlF toxin-antitoxin module
MPTSYVMKVSSNGQVSIPAEARSRWHADRVVVVDLGDRIVMRPLPEEPVAALVGKYQDRGPNTDEARRTARKQEVETARRKTR